MTTPELDTGNPKLPVRRSYIVWVVGVVAFIVSIMQRTTLGVSGLEAAERFSITPAALSLFVFVQVAVYMVMQIPAGVLVDRYGPRLVAFVSCVLAAAGQLLLATTDQVSSAVAARVVVGCGDALMFVAVLALLPHWFPSSSVPVVTQLTTIFSQLGQIISAVPFLLLLHATGWTTAYGSAASLSLLAAVLVLAALRNSPDGAWSRQPPTLMKEIGDQLRVVWNTPGTRLGFFGHMANQFSMMVFTLLWGLPYLVSAQGLTPEAASGILTLFVLCMVLIGPLMGVFTVRHPRRRLWLLIGICLLTMTAWSAVLVLAHPAPWWLLVLLVVVLAGGGPASVVGFDIARTTNPGVSAGVAQSMVNVGGYLATLAILLAMGVLLDRLGGFTFDAFRVAWLVQYPFWLIALIGIVTTRRKARRLSAAEGIRPRPLQDLHRTPRL
ncbi:MFS transporter (plasmid) [Rhodococcus sp. USK10]|uniref:MFS transporter n=1 Tax=Rhodococcus sp. USK10 TaxID=2789739 RepID=UPI001C5D76A9|nr:MFS transporter [Rhodococcus sp. USK10]QYB00163.1 MFS transporter [Rhodococcus sp. USK10]